MKTVYENGLDRSVHTFFSVHMSSLRCKTSVMSLSSPIQQGCSLVLINTKSILNLRRTEFLLPTDRDDLATDVARSE